MVDVGGEELGWWSGGSADGGKKSAGTRVNVPESGQ
jgi:hypothetical protein